MFERSFSAGKGAFDEPEGSPVEFELRDMLIRAS